MKRVWVFMVALYNGMKIVKEKFQAKLMIEQLKAAKEFSASRIRGRFKHVKMLKYAQCAEQEKLIQSGVKYIYLNRDLL